MPEMKKNPIAIIGLGNPGNSYKNTRHNVGFMAVDFINQHYNGLFRNVHLHYEVSEISSGLSSLLLIKPLTYMNLSGLAVDNVLKTYRMNPSDLILVCDDIHLPVGRMRIRKSGRDGGQKGLRSIFDALGTNTILRIRIGVGILENGDIIEHVLSDFFDEEMPVVQKCIQMVDQAVFDIIEQGTEYAMNFYNGLNLSSEPCSL